MLTLLRKITLPHLRRDRLRVLVTVTAMTLAVATVVALDLVSRTVVAAARDAVRDVAGRAQLSVANGEVGVPEAVLDVVRAQPEVEAAVAVMDVRATAQSLGGEPLQILGLDLVDDHTVRTFRIAGEAEGLGDPLELLAQPSSVLVTKALAARHRLAVGDRVEVLSSGGVRSLAIRGLLEADGAANAYGGNVAVMDLFAAQQLFGRRGFFQRVDVVVRDGAPVDAVREDLATRLAGGAVVETSDERGGQARSMVNGIAMATRASSLIGLAVALFLVYTTQAIAVARRRREFAVLRVLGVTVPGLRRYLQAEAVLLALPGCLLGLPLGWLEARAALPVLGDTVSGDVAMLGHLELAPAVQAFAVPLLLGLVAALLGALLPSLAATRAALATALGRRTELLQPAIDRRGTRVGLAVTTVALALSAVEGAGGPRIRLLVFPMLAMGAALCLPGAFRQLAAPVARMLRAVTPALGTVAAGNLGTAPRLAAATAAMIMLATASLVALRIVLGGLATSAVQWGERFYPLDLMVTSGSPMLDFRSNPMPPEVAEGLRAIPGVADLNGVRVVEFVPSSAGTVRLIAQDVALWTRHGGSQTLYQGTPETTAAALGRGEVLVSDLITRRHGLGVGDTITLQTPAGGRPFRIGGVYGAGFVNGPDGAVQMDVATFRRAWMDERITSFAVFLAPGADPEAVRAAIRTRFGARWALFIITFDEFTRIGLDRLERPFQVAQVANGLVALLAAFGILNTLLAAVLDRRRDIALLRSSGATRSQVAHSVLLEAAVLGTVGIASGLALGLVTSRSLLGLFSQFGWFVPFHLPAGPLLGAVGGLLAVVLLAGFYPARRAAGLCVVEELHGV